MREIEVPLVGGNVADGVVRVGDTVRKPVGAQGVAVAALLRHLNDAGFEAAPEVAGWDDRGRLVLEYVPGELADTLPPMDVAELHRLGELLRRLHDLCAEFTPPADARWDVAIAPDRHDLVCHHDLAPWNLVRAGDRWVFIDWDGAGPGSRLWDLGYAAHGFVTQPLTDPEAALPRLRALVDGYRLDSAGRTALPGFMADHLDGMYRLLRDGARTGTQPWARLYAEGHGDYWRRATEYVRTHHDRFATALGG